MNPATRFTDRAADYAKYRPNYPADALDAMLRGLGDPTSLTAADVGAGTGISSRLLSERGVNVVAIEPNRAMRDAAVPHPRVEWRDGAGEATGLPDASVDLVLVAQAFHWFRQREAIVEFQRILRPEGRLALLWNNRDRSDPLTRGYIDAIHAVHGEDLVEQRPFDPEVIAIDGRFSPSTLSKFPHKQVLDQEGLIGRAVSASYVPRHGAEFVELQRLMAELFERHRDPRGLVTLRYVTKLYLATRK
jgi:SAM-dependent methyltransferase